MAKYILAYVRNYPQRLCMEANLLCTYTQIVFKQTFICTLGWIVYYVYFHRHDAFHCLNQNYFFGESHFLCATLEINYGGTWINLLTPILIFFNIFLNITFRLFEYVIVISPCSSSSDRLKKSIMPYWPQLRENKKMYAPERISWNGPYAAFIFEYWVARFQSGCLMRSTNIFISDWFISISWHIPFLVKILGFHQKY